MSALGKMLIAKGKELVSALLIASFTLPLAACGGGAHIDSAASRSVTKDYGIDVYTGYDDNGNVNPTRSLTLTESTMVESTDQHCVQVTKEVRGRMGQLLKQGGKFTVLTALGTAVGAVTGFPGVKFMQYLKYGAGAGLAGGLETGSITTEQALSIVHSYCVLMWVQKNTADLRDRRLSNVIIIPTPMLGMKRPTTDASRKTEKNRDIQDKIEESLTPPPPVIIQ